MKDMLNFVPLSSEPEEAAAETEDVSGGEE